MICGAYGRGNAGDDAILEAILQEMRSIDPDMPITVLSKDPKSTRLTYRVRAVHRSNFLAWHTAMWNSRLYINGGGSLIQDVTSRRSLWFYLANIRAAKRAGNRVQMYGCGIGPVTRESHRKLAAKIINQICGRHHPAGAGLSGGAAGHGRDGAGGPVDRGPGADRCRRPRTTRPTACCCAPASRPTAITSALPCGGGRGLRRRPPSSARRRNTPTAPMV